VKNRNAGAIGNGNDNPETFQYYYHSDHLGSISLITDLDGNVVQHVEYVPFDEVFIEERNNRWNTPYLFNAKELDEETGLYYYGARYYDGRVSLWLGVDPMWEKYPGISVFAYCGNNPVKYVDPNGKWIVNAIGALASGGLDYAGQVAGNFATGMSWEDALLNDISWGSIAVSAVEGAINPIGGVSKAATKAVVKTTATTVLKTALKEGATSAAGQVLDNVIKGKDLGEDVLINAVVGGVVGNAKKLAPKTTPKANQTIRDLNIKLGKGKELTKRQTERMIEAKTEKMSNDLIKGTIDYTVNSNKKILTNITNVQEQ
jgi:RHS repeat-associated protein